MLLTIEAENAEALKSQVLDLARIFGLQSEDPNQLPLAPVANVGANGNAEPARRGRRTKAEMAASAAAATTQSAPEATAAQSHSASQTEQQVQPAQPTATANATGLTKDQVNAELQKVLADKGTDIVRGILSKHGANRLSELKPEQYQSVVNACAEALKQA